MRVPTPVRKLYDAWMILGRAIGRVMSTILLTVFWIFALGLYAIILKIMKYLKGEKEPVTYWIDVPAHVREELLHPF